jgi:hypothetical protein
MATVCVFFLSSFRRRKLRRWFFHFSNEWIEAPTIKKLNELMAATEGVDPFYPLCASSADHFRIPESERFRSDPV